MRSFLTVKVQDGLVRAGDDVSTLSLARNRALPCYPIPSLGDNAELRLQRCRPVGESVQTSRRK